MSVVQRFELRRGPVVLFNHRGMQVQRRIGFTPRVVYGESDRATTPPVDLVGTEIAGPGEDAAEDEL
jgi:hypothetical protein